MNRKCIRNVYKYKPYDSETMLDSNNYASN